MKLRYLLLPLLIGALMMPVVSIKATKYQDLRIIDKQYLMVHFRDGEVHYRDEGIHPADLYLWMGDGDPGTHPGQTPFNGTETWSPNNGGDARMILKYCYPDWDNGGWPQQESYFNQRYFWVNAEFTPRETMRGKMALLAYLYGIRK